MTTFVGIDLASAPEYGAKRYNRLGLAALDDRLNVIDANAGRFTDRHIFDFVRLNQAALVAIDSPLSWPVSGILREVDRLLIKHGFRPYPPLLPSMVALTMRGIALRAALQEEGFDVIEAFPGAAQDVLGLPRKQTSKESLAVGLRCLGIHPPTKLDGDMLDAVTAAYVEHCYLSGSYEAIGSNTDVQVINPRLEVS